MGEQSILTFPEWLSDIDEDIEDKIHSILKENSISAEQAKKLIEEKVKSGFFSKKDIDFSKMTFNVENSFAIELKQKRHHEIRNIKRETAPYDTNRFAQGMGLEDELEELWEKDDLWEGDYLPKFTKKTLSWVRSGSAEISECTKCNSNGQIRCSKCKGNGEYWEKCYSCNGKGVIKNKCPSCNGRGKVNEGQITIGGGKRIGSGAGYSSRDVQCVRCNASGYLSERCDNCNGQGKNIVTCSKCDGHGALVCPKCLGHCQLFTYDSIETVSKPSEQDFIISNLDNIKKSWFNLDKENNGEYFEILGNVDIEDYGKPVPKEGRVLLEGYDLKIIPVSKVIFKDDKKEKSVYFVGKNRKIVGADSSYLDYTKLLLFVILPIIVAITLLYFFAIK